MIKATNKATGEVIELEVDNLEKVVSAWRVAQEYEKTAKALKDQLKKIVPKYVSDNGNSEEVSNHVFKINTIQRMTYDKSVVRSVLDPDTFDVLTKVDKTAVDNYLKENIETLGEVASTIRQSMIPDGKPYEVIKLEKQTREA